MTNPLEGMKAVYKDEVLNIIEIDMFNSYFTLDSKKKFTHLDVPFHKVKPLLKFPDKDSEGNDCWDRDVVEWCGKTGILILTKYEWRFMYRLDNGKVTTIGFSIDPFIERRICSSYDNCASDIVHQDTLDHLPEDVVNKLKETV